MQTELTVMAGDHESYKISATIAAKSLAPSSKHGVKLTTINSS